MSSRKEKIGYSLTGTAAVMFLIGLLVYGPIPQDPQYHLFSDTREVFGIPNFWNVLSNIPFLVVGLAGLYRCGRQGELRIVDANRSAYIALFAGSTLVAFGSGYYHLWPDNQTLFWDRLPMTIAFMGLLSVIVGEFISARLGKILLLPLLVTGVSSVLYWYLTEQHGSGDLRFYAIVQFFPMIVIPVILLCFKSRFSGTAAYWWLLAIYLAAKIFEHYDGQIHDQLIYVSGHSIKHLAAALGLWILLRSYRLREPLALA